MHANLLVIALLGSSAMAAPRHHKHKRHNKKPCSSVSVPVASETQLTAAAATTTSSSSAVVTVYPTTTPEAASPTTTVATTPSSTSTTEAAPSATSTSSGGCDYIPIVNKWRSAMGLPELTQKPALEQQAQKTVDDMGDSAMTLASHELDSSVDAMAQVLAQGYEWTTDGFASAYVKGWLCEKPDLAVLADQNCPADAASDGTGHYDILTSTDYHSIGCAGANGNIGCSLGFNS